MIQEDYVTFEQAKLLKEKGFPQDIDEDFPDRTMILFSDAPNDIIDFNSADIQGFLDNEYLKSHNIEWYVVPMFSSVQKWLRKEKNIHIMISIYNGDNDTTIWSYSLYQLNPVKWLHNKETYYNSYPEAMANAIDEVLKTI